MASVSVIIGVLAVSVEIGLLTVVFAAISAFLISGASFAINDFCDRELDESTARHNPLTKGDVSTSQALAVFVSFSIVGVSLSTLTNSWITASLAGTSALLGIAYSLVLKPYMATIGNLATSYSFGITFVYGASIFGPAAFLTVGAVFFMFAMSVTSNLSREIIKGIADREGDNRRGIRTVAVTRGSAFAAFVALAVMIVTVAITYVPLLLGTFRSSYAVVITLTDILLVLLAVSVYLRPMHETAVHVKNDLLAVMLIGLIAFLIGPHFEYYTIYAVPFEALAMAIFVLLLRKSSTQNLWFAHALRFDKRTR